MRAAFLLSLLALPATDTRSICPFRSGVPAWRSSSWTPYGGATRRNRADRTDEAKRLKLGTEESRLETVPAKRNLDDEEDVATKA